MVKLNLIVNIAECMYIYMYVYVYIAILYTTIGHRFRIDHITTP